MTALAEFRKALAALVDAIDRALSQLTFKD